MGVVPPPPPLVRTWVFRGILSSSNILKSVYKEQLFSLLCVTQSPHSCAISWPKLSCSRCSVIQLGTLQKKKNLFIDLQETADLDTFLEEILNGELHFYAVEVP